MVMLLVLKLFLAREYTKTPLVIAFLTVFQILSSLRAYFRSFDGALFFIRENPVYTFVQKNRNRRHFV